MGKTYYAYEIRGAYRITLEIGKVALGVSYFNSVKELPRCLDPIYKHVDYIIAVDGRYINYEDKLGRDYSEDGSTELLQKRYPNVIIEKCKPMFQTDKRQRYLDIAGELGCEYLIVFDTDDIIHPEPKHQNWKRFYKNLEKYSARYPDYRIFKMKSWIPSIAEWPRAYNHVRENVWHPYIRIHKDPGNQRYCMFCHWWWCPKDATDEDIVLQNRGMYIADHTIDGVRFTTNSVLRGQTQLYSRNRWAWNNDCEEKRRQYILSMHLRYVPEDLEKLGVTTEFDGYWRYDDSGRQISKICEEDGSPPKEKIVPNISKSPKYLIDSHK